MNRILSTLILLASTVMLVPGMYGQDGCSNAILTGSYSYNLSGWVVALTSDGHLDLTSSTISNFVGTATFDGGGMFSTSFYSCANGVCGRTSGSGTYHVNSDCSGKLQLGSGKNANHWGLAVSNEGSQVDLIGIDPGNNVSGTLRKQ